MSYLFKFSVYSSYQNAGNSYAEKLIAETWTSKWRHLHADAGSGFYFRALGVEILREGPFGVHFISYSAFGESRHRWF